MATSEWHWEQGGKFAVEGIKTSLLLNGAAGIALMSFGTAHGLSPKLIWTVVPFAVGAVLSALAFLFAYLTQLMYGNGEELTVEKEDHATYWRRGQRFNSLTLWTVLSSVVAFAVGIVLAAIWVPVA